MESRILREEIRGIEMSAEMQARILENCYKEMEEKKMNKSKKNVFNRPMVAVASLALCLCLTGVTALASTGKLQGFFKDITSWNGAVTGTSYEQATDEIELTVMDVSDNLTVAITMVKPEEVPYSSFETFGVESYKIVDMNGNVVVNGNRTELVNVIDGKVNVNISLENISDGEYKLIVSKLVGSAKAEQPLVVSGIWECEFVH